MTYDQILEKIQRAIISTLTRIGIFIIPLMPAMFLGIAVYNVYRKDQVLATICAVAIEIIGIVIADHAMENIDAWQNKEARAWKAISSMIMLPIPPTIVSAVVYFSGEELPPVIKGLGIAGAYMAMLVYVSMSINKSIKIERERKKLEKAERKAEKLANKSSEKTSPRKSSSESEKEDVLRKELLPRPNWMDFTPRMKFEFVGGVKDGRIRLPAGIKAPELAQYVPVSVRSCQDWLNEIKNGEAFV